MMIKIILKGLKNLLYDIHKVNHDYDDGNTVNQMKIWSKLNNFKVGKLLIDKWKYNYKHFSQMARKN